MRLDRIYTQITEAFKAGNKARKKETAQDAAVMPDSPIDEDLRDLVNDHMFRASMEACVEVNGCDKSKLAISGDNSQVIVRFMLPDENKKCFVLIYPAEKHVILHGGKVQGIKKIDFDNDDNFTSKVNLMVNMMHYVEMLIGTYKEEA